AGLAHVVGGDGADGRVGVGARRGQLLQLLVVGVALAERALEDRRVGGDPDDAAGLDQLGEIAAADAIARQIVEPDRHPRRGQCRDVLVLCHGACYPFTFSSVRCAAATTASSVRPNSRNSVLKSADAPKCSIETISPASPANRCHGIAIPASTTTRARTEGGSTSSR